MTTPAPGPSGPVTATRIASIGRRIGAVVIDGLIVGVVIGIVYGLFAFAIVGAAVAEDAGALLGLTAALGFSIFALGVAWILVLSALQAGKGSVGQRATRIAVVRRDSGERLSFGAAFGRNLVFGLAGSIVVGYFSPLFDSSGLRQGWHDKVVGAVMVDRAVANVADAVASAPVAAPAPPAPPVPFARPWLPTPLPTPGPENAYGAPPAPVTAPAVTAPSSPPLAVPTGLVSAVPGFSRPAAADPAPGPPTAPESIYSRAVPPGPPTSPPAVVVAPPAPAAPAAESPDAVAPSAPPAVPPVEPAVSAPVLAPAVTPPAAQPSPADSDLDETRLQVPRRDGRAVVLVWDDASEHVLTGTTVFGRNPEPVPGVVTIAVPDATRSLSKTHFEVVVEDGTVFLTDRHSTNGTAVTAADGALVLVTPGERVPVAVGVAVVIGDRSFTVGARE